jgi:hypothetical protein
MNHRPGLIEEIWIGWLVPMLDPLFETFWTLGSSEELRVVEGAKDHVHERGGLGPAIV